MIHGFIHQIASSISAEFAWSQEKSFPCSVRVKALVQNSGKKSVCKNFSLMVQRLWNSIMRTHNSARKYLALLIFIHSFIHLLNKYLLSTPTQDQASWCKQQNGNSLWSESTHTSLKTRQCVWCYDRWKHREPKEYEKWAWPGWFKEGLLQRSLHHGLRGRSKKYKEKVFDWRYSKLTVPSVVREPGKNRDYK